MLVKVLRWSDFVSLDLKRNHLQPTLGHTTSRDLSMDEDVEPNSIETIPNEILDNTMLDLNLVNPEVGTTKVTLEEDKVAITTLVVLIEFLNDKEDSHMKLGVEVFAPVMEIEEVRILRERGLIISFIYQA